MPLSTIHLVQRYNYLFKLARHNQKKSMSYGQAPPTVECSCAFRRLTEGVE